MNVPIVKVDEKHVTATITEYEKSFDGGILDGTTWYLGIIETEDYIKVQAVHEDNEQVMFTLRTFGKYNDDTTGNFTFSDAINYIFSKQLKEDIIEYYTAYIKRDGYGNFEGRLF